MANENVEPIESAEYKPIRKAVAEAIGKYKGVSRYFSGKKYCEINAISDDIKGIGLFDLQGAKYNARYIDGSFEAQYPFSVLIRKVCTSDKQILDMTSFADGLGEYIESAKIDIGSDRRITSLVQTVATFVQGKTDNNIVTLQANFLLKYRKEG